MSNTMGLSVCPICKEPPVRRDEEAQTWLECPNGHISTSKVDVRSDDYAYTRTTSWWESRVKQER